MRLLTAHKILIGTSIFGDTAFTAWCFFEYWGNGGTHLLWMAVLSTIIAIGFCFYLLRLIKNDPFSQKESASAHEGSGMGSDDPGHVSNGERIDE